MVLVRNYKRYLLYNVRAGCAWRLMPNDLPPCRGVPCLWAPTRHVDGVGHVTGPTRHVTGAHKAHVTGAHKAHVTGAHKAHVTGVHKGRPYTGF